MKLTAFIRLAAAVVLAVAGLWAAPAVAQKSADWAGQFVTEYEGQPGQLSLLPLGTWLGGTYVANGEQYTLVGRIDGSTATGTVTDPYAVQAPFEARLHAAGLVITVRIRDATGVEVPLSLNFERPEVAAKRRASAGPGLLAGGGGAAASAGAGGAAAGDARLVGAWRATEAGRSGDFTWASDSFIRFAADGSCADGGGRTYAGGATGSVGTGGGGVTVCQWRAQNRVLYLQTGGGWQQVASYAVHEDGSLMMWTYADGSKRIWERQ